MATRFDRRDTPRSHAYAALALVTVAGGLAGDGNTMVTDRAETSGGSPTLWRQVVCVAVLLALYAVAFLDRQVLTLLFEPIRRDLAIDDVQLSLAQGLAFISCFVLFSWPVGWAVDRLSRRWIIFGGVVIWSIAAISSGLAQTYTHLFISRCFVGAGEAALMPAAYSLLSDVFPRRRLTAVLSIFSTGAILGASTSLVLGGYLVDVFQVRGEVILPWVGILRPWQQVLAVSGLPGLALAAFVFLVPDPRGVVRAGASATEGRARLLPFLISRRRFVIGHFLTFALLNVVAASFVTWTPSFLVRVHGLSVGDIGRLVGIANFCGGVTGMLLSGFIVNQWFASGRKDAHLVYYAILAVLLTVLGFTALQQESATVFLIMWAFILAMFAFIGVASSALQLVAPPELRGQLSALFLMFYNLMGFGAGPTLAAAISQHIYRDPMRIGDALALIFLVVTPLAGLAAIYGAKGMRAAAEAAETAHLSR